MKELIIIQARTGSTRFPAKVIHDIQGIPLLSHCIRRLKRIDTRKTVLVATSSRHRDDPIESIAQSEGVLLFRGCEEDVLGRFYQAALTNGCPEYIIRATADNPLVDPYEARHLIELCRTGKWDYISGYDCINGQGLPKGVGLEAFTFNSLKYAHMHTDQPNHREHINDYFLDNKDDFEIHKIICDSHKSAAGLNLSIDTQEDLLRILNISEVTNKLLIDLTLADIIKYYNTSNSKRNV